jgi:uncharacterized protein YdaU (DUF1376 family)
MGLPYFPMYPTDFEADTSHLSMAEDGAYNRLLRICWMTPGCSMPADEAWIMRRVRAHSDEDKQAVKAVLGEFFTIIKGRYSNARLAREFAAASEAHEKRKKAGSKGGRAKAAKVNDFTSSNAKAMPKQPEPEPEPEIDTNVSIGAASPSKPKRRKPSKQMPDDWTPDQATALRLRDQHDLTNDDLQFCYEQFRDDAHAKDKRFADWNRAFATWVRNSVNWGQIGPGSKRRGNQVNGTGSAFY